MESNLRVLISVGVGVGKSFIKHAWFNAVLCQKCYLAYELEDSKHKGGVPQAMSRSMPFVRHLLIQ